MNGTLFEKQRRMRAPKPAIAVQRQAPSDLQADDGVAAAARAARVPKAEGIDQTFALLREGYAFIGNRCDRFGSDIFKGRLMLREVTCMRGAAAAALLYGSGCLTRVGAMPVTTLKLLQDFRSVQTLEDGAHRERKRLFLRLAGPEPSLRLVTLFCAEWRRHFAAADSAEPSVLFDAARSILTRAVLRWCAIPAGPREIVDRTRDLSEMIEASGSIGPRMWRALLLRGRCERWARRTIVQARSGRLPLPPGSPLHAIAHWCGSDGKLLDVSTAAVELLNVLRPTVAVARFIVFAALYLRASPDSARRIVEGDDAFVERFVTEVRRLAPFFPFIGARVRRGLEWQGTPFAPGDWVLLDLYGTSRDPARWPDAAQFRPDRWVESAQGPYDFVPQGAGDPARTHRCPGERITTELMKAAVCMLVRRMHYDVPDQDLSVNLTRIPALPASGFVMSRCTLRS